MGDAKASQKARTIMNSGIRTQQYALAVAAAIVAASRMGRAYGVYEEQSRVGTRWVVQSITHGSRQASMKQCYVARPGKEE